MKYKFFYLSCFIIICSFIFGYFYFVPSNQTPNNINTEQYYYKASPHEVISKLTDNKKGVYYFGFPSCPWCAEIRPVFSDVLKECTQKSYTLDTKSKELSSQDYKKLETFYHRFYKDEFTVPFIVSINSRGEVVTHVGTLEEHDATTRKLTRKETKKLRKLLVNLVKHTKN